MAAKVRERRQRADAVLRRIASSRLLLVAVWIAFVAAGSLLALFAGEAGPLLGDLVMTLWLQEWLTSGDVAGSLLAYADRVVWFLSITAFAVALIMRQWLAASFIFLAGFTGLLLSYSLKLLVARPRPSGELVRVVDPSEAYGFPSTTALLSVVLLGMVCYLLWRFRPPGFLMTVTLVAASLLIVASGLSRVYAGEHWATDVLGGWLFGAGCLLVLVAVHSWYLLRQVRRKAN